MPPASFTHLHLHTSYSLLDGAIRIKDLMAHCKSTGMGAVAMTDHGNMYGAIQFYKEAQKAGIKPIIGCEFYIAPGSRFETRQDESVADGNNFHLILLARNEAGYRNIIKLTSLSYTEGFYRKPRIDYDLLAKHSEGLVGLSACLAGEVQRKIVLGKEAEALRLAGKLQEILGPEHFYLEIQDHGLPEDQIVARGNLEIHKKTGIPLVLTNDAHFLRREDQMAQEVLLRINQKKNITEPLFFSFNDEFYVKNPAEMALIFPELPGAFANTQRIADMVELSFQFGNPLLPRFDVPPGETRDSYLLKLSRAGLERRYPVITPEIEQRFAFEYETITKMDFAGYFLIVQDFIRYARDCSIPVGPGRGSAAGSIISYALGITDIDPLRYDLLFERFLNPDRNEMPDIDIDFCTERREEVINYVRERYGEDHVGQIVTHGTMGARACIKDVARVLNIPFDEANKISSLIPSELNIKLDRALESSADLRKYAEKGDLERKLFAISLALEGNARHSGVHAAGVVIAPEPLAEIVPMATVAPAAGSKNRERIPVTQYDKGDLESVGLVKMDFLGLRNLTIIQNTLDRLKKENISIAIGEIPLDDPLTYKMLQKGDVAGVFQLESSGMREFVLKTRPTCFEDIIALIALFRPGPLESGMANSFIDRKNGKETVRYPHPDLEGILKDTYGVFVYQEQVMLISRIIGGFTPGESDALRKAMGKKDEQKMEAMRIKFVEGARSRGYDAKFAAELYAQMAEFAKYAFNKSHSAAYAMIVYQTAYLKANHPTAYMCAVLDSVMDHTESLVPYIQACARMGISILGPDINESEATFASPDASRIRFGLAGIKNVGQAAVDSILAVRRKEGAFSSFSRFLERIDLKLCNKRMLESLIVSGAFDSMGYTRRALCEGLELALRNAQSLQSDRLAGQSLLFGAAEIHPLPEFIPRGPEVLEYEESARLLAEKDVLGFYLSGHPIARYARILRSIKSRSIQQLLESRSSGEVELAGVIREIQIKVTRQKKEMARISIEDMSGNIRALVFPEALSRLKDRLVKDTPLFIKGQLERDDETGTTELIVKDVALLTEEKLEEKLERALHLRLDLNLMQPTTLQKLHTILRCHSGPLHVFFHLEDDRVIRAHESFNVALNQDMIGQLRSVDTVKGLYLSVGKKIRTLS